MNQPDLPVLGKIQIIVAELPPTIDGIGDYTARLAEEFAAGGHVSSVDVLTGAATADPIPGVAVRHVFDPSRPSTTTKLLGVIADGQPDWVVLQYNPFSYGRRGFNLVLPRVMKKIRRVSKRTRLAIMFHETYVPIIDLKFAAMTAYQRLQFYQLGRSADALFFSIDPWAQLHRRRFAPRPVHHLPVGSNIPHIKLERSDARRRLNIDDDEIVLGVFGNAHASRLFTLVNSAAKEAAAQKLRVRLIYIGSDAGAFRAAMDDPSSDSSIRIIADGPHSADEVSRRLSAIDIFLATYSDGVSTRRGAMIAAMQHGLAIVGTLGYHTDSELHAAHTHAMWLVPATDAGQFAAAVTRLATDGPLRARLGENAQNLFESRYSWPSIARQMISFLAAIPR